jgi:DNA sulfur modification protein DndD
MFFEEISLDNFASYKGANRIELLPKSPSQPIILIGGENGCGKTSLLDAFQLILFGPAAKCSNRGKLTYDKYLEQCINRDAAPEIGARIELVFHFFSGGEKKRYKIERRWFIKGKKLKEHFWVYSYSENGIKYESSLAENWSDYIEGFFPSQVAPFFLFDGEKIEELADFEKSGYLVHAAIHSLLGLNIVDQLEIDLTIVEKRKHKELASSENHPEVEISETAINELKGRIEELKLQEAQYNNQLDQLIKDQEQIELRFRQQGGELFQKQTELENQLAATDETLHFQEDYLRELAAGVAPLLLVKGLLSQAMDQAHNESVAQRESLLLETLEQRDRKLMTKIQQFNLGQEHLIEVEQHLLNDRHSRKTATEVETYLNLSSGGVKNLEHLLSVGLPELTEKLPELLQKIQDVRDKKESLERSLAGVPDGENIAKIIAEREASNRKIAAAEAMIAVATEDIIRAQRQLDQKSAELRRELIRVAHSRFESKDARRMVQYSTKVRGTLEIFREKIVVMHLEQIENLVLDSFKVLLRKKSLVHQLKIDRDTYQVRLYNENKEELLPERLSAGERQLLATALLWGICQSSGKPLPTIIDTPLGRLDTSHRTNLVKNYFPNSSHQVLLLSTNEEIIGKYHDDLKPYISHTFLLNHNEKHGGTTVEHGYFQKH